MKTERIIKKQARLALKGNISKLIAAFGITALVFIAAEYLSYLPLYLGGIVNLDTGEVTDTDSVFYTAAGLISTAVMLFASPLLNGFLRLSADTAVRKDCYMPDVFYYFRGARVYFRTVLFNLLVFGVFLFVGRLADPSAYLQLSDSAAEAAFSTEWFISVLCAVLGVVIKVFLYMIFVHYQLIGYALDDSKSVISMSFGMIGFAFSNFSKLFKLMLSFIGWFALCFFVVPALYVVPYFAVAAIQSARWLIELKDRK